MKKTVLGRTILLEEPMEYYEREFLVSRIDAGYLRYRQEGTVLHINAPTKGVQYEAQEIYQEILETTYEEGIMTSIDAQVGLAEAGLWTVKDEDDLKILPDNIDKLKVELYNAAYKSLNRKKIREYLSVHKSELERLNLALHAWDHLTCEGIAAHARWQHIIANSVTLPDGAAYDWSVINITAVMHYFNSQSLTETDVRDLVRNEPWATIWTVRKKHGLIFEEPMTTEQKAMVVWSSIYDNIGESPDCPHKTILEDDDMLDGWLIIQRQNREKEQKQKRGNEFTGNQKIAGSQEVYIPAQTEQDAKDISDLNEGYGERVRRSRLAQVEREGRVPLMKFRDMKQRLQIEATQKLSSQFKGG